MTEIITTDRQAIDAIATLMGTSAEWRSAADFLDDIANIVGSVRPHPGHAPLTYRVRFGHATGRSAPADWDMTREDDATDALRTTRIIGPITGRTYDALDTGERWNGHPVYAFHHIDMLNLIRGGDGRDDNGDGLDLLNGHPVDRVDGEIIPIGQITADVGGDTLLLYVPCGRVWEESPAPPTHISTPPQGET